MPKRRIKPTSMKTLRQVSGLSAKEVAEKLEIAVSTVGNWDQGKTLPTLDPIKMLKLVVLYGCSLEELVDACIADQSKHNQKNDRPHS